MKVEILEILFKSSTILIGILSFILTTWKIIKENKRSKYEMTRKIFKDFNGNKKQAARFGLQELLKTNISNEEFNQIMISDHFSELCRNLQYGRIYLKFDKHSGCFLLKNKLIKLFAAIILYFFAFAILFYFIYNMDFSSNISASYIGTRISILPIFILLTILAAINFKSIVNACRIAKFN